MQLFAMKQDHHAALQKAESITAAAEAAGRPLSASETNDFDAAIAEAQTLAPQIATIERQNTLRAMHPKGVIPSAGPSARGGGWVGTKKVLGEEYRSAFLSWLQSEGRHVDAALYESAGPNGGYAVPVEVAGEIVPLAPAATGVRSICTVVPTTSDIKVPRQTAVGTATGKAESGASANSFTETNPTLDSFTLSAFTAGAFEKMSFELAQDVPAFQAFVVSDLLNAQQQFEEGKYISGSGTNEAQGLIGNVGSLLSPVVAGTDNYGVELINATEDVQALLNPAYFNDNTRYFMLRATALLIRRAQRQANLYDPVFTRVGNKDYLHGVEIAYSAAMPAVAAGNTPILFGDFKAGYVVGDRGGTGIYLKILDQTYALQGQIAVLAYRRSDGRVRRSEAIQAITLHS